MYYNKIKRACLKLYRRWKGMTPVSTRDRVPRWMRRESCQFQRRVALTNPQHHTLTAPTARQHVRSHVHSYADRLQSALLETWNETFGSLVGMREWKATSVPPYLLRSFSRMAERAEVKMPPGILLQVCPRGGSVNASDCRDLREKQEAAAVGAEAEGEGFLSSSVLGAGAAACAMSRSASDVSATLPAAGARRSFMRSDRSRSAAVAVRGHEPGPRLLIVFG